MSVIQNALFKLECAGRETKMHFYMRFQEPKLYRYARRFQWEKIEERCQRRPKQAAKEATFKHAYAPEQTALHRVLEPMFLLGLDEFDNLEEMQEKRHRAAAALVKVNPDAILTTCVLCTTPVMEVCMDPQGSVKDLDMLLTACSESALVSDREGRLPLHYALINNRGNVGMLKSLLSACPEAAKETDRLGRLAIHYACTADPSTACQTCERNAGLSSDLAGALVSMSKLAPPCNALGLELLLGANEDAASVLDNQGMTALHYLCLHLDHLAEMTTDALDAVDVLVREDSGTVRIADKSGRAPISVLLNWHKRLEAKVQQRSDNEEDDESDQYEALAKTLTLCG